MKTLVNLLLKVLPFIMVGYVLSKFRFKKSELYISRFINFALYFLVPVFVFITMWTAPLYENIRDSQYIVIVSVAVVFFGAAFARIYSKIFCVNFRDIALPIVFMNSAYLAIPVNTVLCGETGTFLSVVYNIVITLLYFSAGIIVVSGSVREIFRLPILYCALFGAVLNISGIHASPGLRSFSGILSGITLPVMLCLVGYQIKPVSVTVFRKVVLASLVRMAGGLFVALAICEIFGIIGAARTVCLVTSSMPSAINAYILSKKYNADFSFASSMITVGLILTLVIIPVAIWIK